MQSRDPPPPSQPEGRVFWDRTIWGRRSKNDPSSALRPPALRSGGVERALHDEMGAFSVGAQLLRYCVG